MKFKAVLILVFIFNFVPFSQATISAEEYDPQHTVLALDMAIVSIQRILNTNDRVVLDMEYRNIISNLKLGNIESDNEIIELYQELMNVIAGKILTHEAHERIQKNYNEWERNQIANAIMGIRAYGTDPTTMGATFAVSCVSSYLAYQYTTEWVRKSVDDELFKIDVQERESYNKLQTRLLNSSWRLMRQYKLPDEYRIVQDSVNDLFRAVNEPDSAKSLMMLRSLEKDFRIYPPYWVYRAGAAKKAGNSEETAKCFDEFGKVWRPVLRNDPFMLEAAKYHVQEAMKSGNYSEALRHLEIVREHTPRSDWADNLFAGVSYFVLGQKEKGINCVELNINFESEKEISGVILAHMKEGKLDASTLPDELKQMLDPDNFSIENNNNNNFAETLIERATSGKVEAQLKLGELYSNGEIVEKDYGEAVRWLKKAAYEGNEQAQEKLAVLYYSGGPNLAQDYMNAYLWALVFMKSSVEGADSYLASGLNSIMANTLGLGGLTVLNGRYAWSIVHDIEGSGIFNPADFSADERKEIRQEAMKIIKQIEARKNK